MMITVSVMTSSNSESGVIVFRYCAWMAPAAPAKETLIANARILYSEVLTPDPSALPSSSRIAISPRPNFERRIASDTRIATTRSASIE
jgi:hypothetical protein